MLGEVLENKAESIMFGQMAFPTKKKKKISLLYHFPKYNSYVSKM